MVTQIVSLQFQKKCSTLRAVGVLDLLCARHCLQYVVEDFDNIVFSELLSYLMTGQCSIKPDTVVGIACVAEKFEVEELKQACLDNLSNCLSVASICIVLTQLELYLSYAAAKTIVVQCLEFIDTNAAEILLSQQFLELSENMVHLVLKRESSADLPEIMKVKAAFAWGKLHSKSSGPDFKTLVTPLLKHIKLHLIDPQDIMKVCTCIYTYTNVYMTLCLCVEVHVFHTY